MPAFAGTTSLRMLRKSAETVGSIALTILGLLLVTFIIGRVVPIDPVLAVIGENAAAGVYERTRIELGLDQPLYVQFGRFIAKAVTGDFGVSVLTARPVLDDLKRVFPATIELATLATLIGVLIGVPLGILAAVRHQSWIDHVARIVALIGHSVPVFWLGLMGLLIFYGWLGWVGGTGRQSVAFLDSVRERTGMVLIDCLLDGDLDAFRDAWRHIVLPASVLGYFSLAYICRMTRSFMLEQLGKEYVTAARIKGLSEWHVVMRHAFRNIAVPLVTVIALSYGYLLEGAVLTETVFAWPGLGNYLTDSLLRSDMNGVLGGTILVGMIFISLNLLSDLLYKLLDPRTR
jgi:peptide/nickel transport system permease protein